MPGNRALYDRAMEQSREAARIKQWEEALKQSARALQEFPQDQDARSSAAVALYNTGRYAQALQVFDELRTADPSNPFYVEYIARLHERSGNAPAAVAAYNQLADIQQQRRLTQKAVEALREAVRLAPDDADTRARLAEILAEAGNNTEAAAELVELARRAKDQGNAELLQDAAEAALRFDPNSADAKALLGLDQPAPAEDLSGAPRQPPVSVDSVIAAAQQLQEGGDARGALAQYQRAVELGTGRADVYYSIGLLHQELGEHKQAIGPLGRAANDPEYALSAHYALGAAQQAVGNLPAAAQEYEQTLRLVDLETIGRAESADLVTMYESTVAIYTELGDIARAASLYSTLSTFFASKRWGKERADEFRRKARELTERNMFAKLRLMGTGSLTAPPPAPRQPEPEESTGPLSETWGKIRPITDFLRPEMLGEQPAAPAPIVPPDPIAVLDQLPPTMPSFAPLTKLETNGLPELGESYIGASQKYIESGLIVAALDACHEVIRLAPEYLPIHLRLGEIYERDGRPQEALAKYQLLVEAYAARQESKPAIDVYYRIVDLAPDTIGTRTRLAEVLKNEGRTEAAAEQLAHVASHYFRLGQTNRALEEYRRGLQWAPNSAALHAQYGQTLLRLDRYEAALGEFRRALELKPDDLAGIARINVALAVIGEQPSAIWQSFATLLERLKSAPQQLSEVLTEYRTTLLGSDVGMLHYLLGILEQNAGHHQSALLELEQAADLMGEEDPALPPVLVHQALADSYIALGQPQEALEQLQRGQQVADRPAPQLDPSARHPFSTPLSRGELVRRMAEAFAASGDMAGAEQALREAKQHLPYDRAIYTKLADVYFRQGKLTEALTQLEELATYYEERQDLDRAIETLDYGLKLAPNSIPVGRRAAELHLRRGYLDKGVDGLVRVSELMRKAGQLKDAVASLQKAAEVHWTLSQHDKAREIYDRIVKIAPNDVEARQWLSFMYTLAGQTKDAIIQKKQIVAIYMQSRDYDGAIAELHQIYGLDQSNPETLYQLADVLMRRQEYGQALRTYQRLAKLPNADTDRIDALQTAAKRMLDQQAKGKGPAEG